MVRRNTNTAMLNTRQVARLLNIHNTVRRWSNRGVLKAYRIGPRGDRKSKCVVTTQQLECGLT